MYLEELEIDDYMRRLEHYEDLDEEGKMNEFPPQMSETVMKYHERGELFLDSESENVDASQIAPDILSG